MPLTTLLAYLAYLEFIFTTTVLVYRGAVEEVILYIRKKISVFALRILNKCVCPKDTKPLFGSLLVHLSVWKSSIQIYYTIS